MPRPYEEAQALFRHKRIPEAQRLLEQFLEDSPNDVDARYLLGVCLFRRKEVTRAETCFRHLLTFDNGHVNGRYYLGLCLERQGYAEASRNEYRFVLALQPEHQQARDKLGIRSQLGVQSQRHSQQAPPSAVEPEVTSDPGVKIFEGHREARTFAHVPVAVFVALVTVVLVMVSPLAALLSTLFLLLLLTDLALRSRATTCTVWQRRIDLGEGVIERAERSTWIYEIEDVEFRREAWFMLVNSGTVVIEARGKKSQISGFGSTTFMRQLWREIRDAALVERRGMKKWWI